MSKKKLWQTHQYDLLPGPRAFSLHRAMSRRKLPARTSKTFKSSDIRINLNQLTPELIKRNKEAVEAIILTMPWSEIESAVRRMPSPVRKEIILIALEAGKRPILKRERG